MIVQVKVYLVYKYSFTEEAANTNYAQLSPRVTMFRCSGSTLTISLLVMAACLLLALTHN